jgi:hypothetical protein
MVEAEVARVYDTETFRLWRSSAGVGDGDALLLNNSFLYREGISTTTKSDLYLAGRVGADGVLSAVSVVRSRTRVNSQFKRIARQGVEALDLTDLEEAIRQQLADFGSIIFALVGAVEADVPAATEFPDGGRVRQLRYDPNQEAIALLQADAVSISRLDDLDFVWQSLTEVAGQQNEDIAEIAETFERAFTTLQELAGRPVNIDDVRAGSDSILGQIIARMEAQLGAYDAALETHRSSAALEEASHDLLRIAYNFADAAKSFISLMVGASDMKPLVFWMTASSQFALAERFASLPFSIVGSAKPSLDKYRMVIASARNRAFHDVFAFGRPFHVRLTGEAFRGAELRLFREYGRRNEPALEYEDRRLVHLLESFTRVSERQVPRGFWDQNREVMDAVLAAARSLQLSLVEVSRI